MRVAISAAFAVMTVACAPSPTIQTASVPPPVVVEKHIIVEKPVIIEKRVVVDRPIIVAQPMPRSVPRTKFATRSIPVAGRCTYVRSYTRKNGTRVAGHRRCRK